MKELDAFEQRWSRDGRRCMTCGRAIRFTDPATFVLPECADCQQPQAQGPAVAFVTWNGQRLGFDSLEKAQGFIAEFRKAHEPSVYCGPPVEEPVLEVPLLMGAR